MAKLPLTARQHQILWATVRSYIETAEPVGSKTLAENYNLGVSSATIRTILASLEQHGFLFQPHTSAGRIPSDSGYRVYVDHLLAQGDLDPMPVPPLEGQTPWQDNLDSLLRKAAHLLAGLSGCMAVVTAPQAALVGIRHLQLLALTPHRIMVVIVTDTLQTHSVVVDVPQEGDWETELPLISNFLNFKLRGKTFADLKDLSWLHLDQELRSYASWLSNVLAIVAERYLKPPLGQVYTAGMTELTRQPEFAHSNQFQAILQVLEDSPEDLGAVLDPQSDLVVYIGTENPLEPMRHCTLIVASYYQGSQPLGSVGVLGPTRMPYEQVLSSVQATTHSLSQALSRCA